MQSIIDIATSIRDRARHEQIVQLVDYWLSICPGDRLPGRTDFDPVDIPKVLPYIVLTDVERSPVRFRFRLVGTAVVHAMGTEMTGRYFEDVIEDFENSDLYRAKLDIVGSLQPHHFDGDPPRQWAQDCSAFERVLLPMATDGETVDLILGAYIFRRADGDIEGEAFVVNGQ